MRIAKILFVSLILPLTLTSCGSSKPKVEEVKHEELKKDFVVIDASLDYRPIWTADIEDWASKYKIDLNDFRYFSYETEAKVDREIACKLANANAKSDIAGEITTFILENLASSSEGSAAIDPNDPQIVSMRTFVENNLAQRIQASINGASVMKTYWEKRNYKKDLGAKKDYIGYTCASLVRIKKDQLETAIEKAGKELEKAATSPAAKEKAKSVIDQAEKAFLATKPVAPAESATEVKEEKKQ